MAQVKMTAGQTRIDSHRPSALFSIASKALSVPLISGLIGLGSLALIPWATPPAFSLDSVSDRHRSFSSLPPSLTPPRDTHFIAESSLESHWEPAQPSRLDGQIINGQPINGQIINGQIINRQIINRQIIDEQTVAQLADILWDIIPADILPPDIIPDSEFVEFLQDAGELLQTVSDRRGQYALITASALANDNPQLVSWLSQLQDSPLGTMTFSGIELGDFSERLITTLNKRDQAVDAIALQSQQESTTDPSMNFETLPDLRETGSLNVMTNTIAFGDGNALGKTEQNATGMVDIYAPAPVALADLANESALGEADTSPSVTRPTTRQSADRPAPVIVISHGVGGARHHFAELANHLASYGFVVVVPDHKPGDRPETDAPSSQSVTAQLTQLGEQLFGELNPVEFVNRPLTISALLDELERLNASDPQWMGQLDLENVGIIGHSLGGYTGLALASGELNRKQVKRTCKDDEMLTANLSLVLQCQAEGLPRRLPSLKDDRIKAVMALNPVASAVLGESQIKDIEVPVMIVTASHDAIAPMMAEQIPTFSWLTTAHKYLVTMVPAGHASVNLNRPPQSSGRLSQLVSGPPQALGAEATQALSVAFMKAHLSHPLSNSESPIPYLNAAYGKALSNRGVQLHLITDLGDQF